MWSARIEGGGGGGGPTGGPQEAPGERLNIPKLDTVPKSVEPSSDEKNLQDGRVKSGEHPIPSSCRSNHARSIRF